LEHCSNLSGTGLHLNYNNAGAEKAHYKGLSNEEVMLMGYGVQLICNLFASHCTRFVEDCIKAFNKKAAINEDGNFDRRKTIL